MKQGALHGQINSFVQFLDITFKGWLTAGRNQHVYVLCQCVHKGEVIFTLQIVHGFLYRKRDP